MSTRGRFVSLAAGALATLLVAGPAAAQCAGDCNGDGAVAINELITGVNIALGTSAVFVCPSFDVNGDGAVAINELIAAVNNALAGCLATATPTIEPPTATVTASATAAATDTATVAPTATATATATAPASATPTVESTFTATAQPTDTETADTETPTASPTATRTATPTRTPQGPPVCGNGIVENTGGETCDDGNTDDTDGCPANCRVETCAPSGQRLRIDVDFATASPELLLQTLVLFVRYPDGTLDVPGASAEPPVLASITSDLFAVTPRDFDYAARLLLEDPTLIGVASGRAATIEFEICQGASAPPLEAITCLVENASDPNFVQVPVEQVTCTLAAGSTPTPTDTPQGGPTATETPAAPATPTVTAQPPTGTPTATFTATPSPTAGTSSECGNGVLEPGETCLTCAPDCTVGACTSPGTPTQAFVVDLVSPLGFQPTTATLLLGYDSTLLSLPGMGTATSVRQRVVAPAPVPQAFTPNDLDYAVRVLISRNVPLATLYTATFDRCGGAPAAVLADLACAVEACAAGGSPVPGCTCTVRLP